MFDINDVSPSILIIINLFLGIFITRLIITPVLEMVYQAEFVRPNYKGSLIPMGVGFIFLLTALVVLTVDYLLFPGLLGGSSLTFMLGLAVMTFLGFIDDVLGSRQASGLKGHFKALFKGKLTTGALKALGGGLLALLITASELRHYQFTVSIIGYIVVNTLIIALSINAINLLDLRPGRAGKGFLVLAAVIFIVSWGSENLLPLALVTGSLLAYLPWDLKARAMMGDTGSNALGLILGLSAAWSFDELLKLVYLLILILFHLLTEKYSLTEIISGNKILNYLDKLGRS